MEDLSPNVANVGEYFAFRVLTKIDGLEEELANHLPTWLENLPWESDIFIIMRYCNLMDQNAKEKYWAIRKGGE
jgi:hypothetical protein